MNDKEVRDWESLINRVASSAGRKYDMDQEDLGQDLWVYLLKAQAEGGMEDPQAENAEGNLWWICKTLAEKERSEHLTVSVQYAYRMHNVRMLLETFFDHEDWPRAHTPEDAKSELGAVGVEMSSDLSRAWNKLSTAHKTVIFSWFGLKNYDTVDRKALTRAIRRMTDVLNTYQGKPPGVVGKRTVISNTRAAGIIRRQDEG